MKQRNFLRSNVQSLLDSLGFTIISRITFHRYSPWVPVKLQKIHTRRKEKTKRGRKTRRQRDKVSTVAGKRSTKDKVGAGNRAAMDGERRTRH